jgi:PAS domain S-box-containing protein
LKKFGYKVERALNGKEALKELHKGNFDMILSDILMPVMDGFELCRLVRKDKKLRNIPIILVTGNYIDKKDEELVYKLGADKFIKKPVNLKKLIKDINNLFSDIDKGDFKFRETSITENKNVLELHKDRLLSQLKKKTIELEKEIAERKKKEEELQKSLKMRTVAEKVAKLGSWEWDMGSNKLTLSENSLRIYGFKPEDYDGEVETVMNLIHPDDRKEVKEQIEQMLSEKKQIYFQYRIITPDGIEKVLEGTNQMYFDNNGNITHLMGHIQDITERKKMEEEILKVKKLESLSILAGGIAHDFNNLLNVIMGNISVVKMQVKPGDDISEMLDEAEKASKRAGELTAEFITFSKGGEPLKEPVNISELIKTGFDSASLCGSGATCVFTLPDDLWIVEADAAQFRQAMKGILLNACEAMPEGGTINISAENMTVSKKDRLPLKEGKYAHIKIEDQGIGIPEENLAKIFDPYFTTKETWSERGLGLGLAICHSIIQQHGGTITAESEAGAGTTMHIYLPALI